MNPERKKDYATLPEKKRRKEGLDDQQKEKKEALLLLPISFCEGGGKNVVLFTASYLQSRGK